MITEKPEKLIIIGSGPAALTAAIYAARAQLSPLVIEGNAPGGQLMGTTYVENWPGNIRILGPQLMMNMRDHAAHYGARFLEQEVVDVDCESRPFLISTHKKQIIAAHALIIATGCTPRRLGCPGEDFYWGKGVTTCAVCDGSLYRGKKVMVVGGGDTAMEDASFMTNFTQDITIVHIGEVLSASKMMQERVLANASIKIIYNSTITQIDGDGAHVNSAIITNIKTGEKQEVSVDVIFLAIGATPNTALFKGKLELTQWGYLVHKEHTQTSVPGIFAAGDVFDARYKQAITSAASGCMAALDAERYLKTVL
jgi:thioredoxin-disulfide reductase